MPAIRRVELSPDLAEQVPGARLTQEALAAMLEVSRQAVLQAS